jgi:hypothetical protein
MNALFTNGSHCEIRTSRDDGQIVLQGVAQGRAIGVCLEAKKHMVKY